MIDRFQLLYEYDGGDLGVWDSLTRNTNLTEEQIDLLYQTKGVDKNYLAQYPKLTEEQFMRFFNDEIVWNKNYFAKNPHLTEEQIDFLYQTEGVDKNYLAQYPKLTEEQFMRFFNDEVVNKDYLAHNPNLTEEQIDLLYKIEGVDKDYLAQHTKLTDEQFMRFFNDEDYIDYLAQNPSINPDSEQVFTKGLFNWRW